MVLGNGDLAGTETCKSVRQTAGKECMNTEGNVINAKGKLGQGRGIRKESIGLDLVIRGDVFGE